MLRALTRAVSPAIARCELTHLDRDLIDPDRAAAQHAAYERALIDSGCTICRVPATPEFPDGVFVEDTAVVVDGLAVLARPGVESRRQEVESVGGVLAGLLPTVQIVGPGTLDGGDVLRLGDVLYVGRSRRTNPEGIRQLAAAVDLEVRSIPLAGALHLKTAATAIDPETLVVQPLWVDAGHFGKARLVEVDPEEPFGANTLRVGRELIVPAGHPRTAEACAPFVDSVRLVEVDELAKAEGGVTCCSILVETED